MKKFAFIAGLFVSLIVFTGCPPANYNEFYFDLETQTFNRCYISHRYGDSVITSMSFKAITPRELPYPYDDDFSISLKIDKDDKGRLKWRDGVRNFNIHNIYKDYDLYISGGLTIDNFRLPPNTEFFVEHSAFTELAPDTLRIKTDSTGRVIYSSKTACRQRGG